MAIGPVKVFNWRERKQFTWEDERPATEERQWYYWSSYNLRWSLREASMVYNYDSTGLLSGMARTESPEENIFTMQYDEWGRIVKRKEGFSEWDKAYPPIYLFEYISNDVIRMTKETPSGYGTSRQDHRYILDDYPNPQWIEQYPVYMINNFTGQTYTEHSNPVDYQYEYEYDANGYPLVRYQVLPDSSLMWVYEYY
jgi:hypothetical protein